MSLIIVPSLLDDQGNKPEGMENAMMKNRQKIQWWKIEAELEKKEGKNRNKKQ